MREVCKSLLGALCLAIFAPWAGAQVPGAGQPVSGQPVMTQSSGPLGDTSALAREATVWLIDLIKINTTNPPGNEEAAAKYIADVLQKEGINAELLPLSPGAARWWRG